MQLQSIASYVIFTYSTKSNATAFHLTCEKRFANLLMHLD